MPITEFLENNARLYPDDISLVEINPGAKTKTTWREFSLTQATGDYYRREMTWQDFDCRANRFADAQPIQHEVNAIIAEACSCHGNMYAVLKKILALNEGVDIGSVRAPLAPLADSDMPQVEATAARIAAAIRRFC